VNGRPAQRHDAPGAAAWVDAALAAHASLRRISPCLGHPLDQGKSDRTLAGLLACGSSRDARPSQAPQKFASGPVAAAGPVGPPRMCIALAAYSCRDSLGFEGQAPLTAFPFKLPFGGTNAIIASLNLRGRSALFEAINIGKRN